MGRFAPGLEALEVVLTGLPVGAMLFSLAVLGLSLVTDPTPFLLWTALLAFLAAAAGLSRRHLSALRPALGAISPPALALGILGIPLLVCLHVRMLDVSADAWISHSSPKMDLAYHLALVSTMCVHLPPGNPFVSGLPLNYHFLADLFSAVLMRVGARLPQAAIMPDVLFSIVLLGLIYHVARRWLKSSGLAALSVLLVGLGGGLGLFYFLLTHPDASYLRQAWADLNTPPDSAEVYHIYWSNLIRDFLLHARTVGPALGLAVSMVLLLGVEPEDEGDWTRGGGAGLCLGLILLTNLNVFEGAALVALGFLLLERGRRLVPLALGAAAAGVPAATWLLWVQAVAPQSLIGLPCFTAGWMDFGRHWLRDWVLNLGPVFILAPVGAIRLTGRARTTYLAALAPFAAGNLISINGSWLNQKEMFLWFFVSCVAASALLGAWWARGGLARWAALGLILTSTATGVSALYYNFDHEIVLFDSADLSAAAILEQTPANSVFVGPAEDDFRLVILSGRRSYLADWGTAETMSPEVGFRSVVRDRILAGRWVPPRFCADHGIDYIVTSRAQGGLTVHPCRD